VKIRKLGADSLDSLYTALKKGSRLCRRLPRTEHYADIDRLGEICALTADGLNLAGIRRVLQLQEETRQLQAELARLRELADEQPAARQARQLRPRPAGP
jgi:hypothetical protein